MVSESFAGITVPEGEPDELVAAAASFEGIGGGLEGVSSGLSALPGALSSWQGPASVSYGGSCLTNGAATSAAREAMAIGVGALRQYATALEDAQEKARKAIDKAKDATARIREAQNEIASAQTRAESATTRLNLASDRLVASSLSGAPDAGALAEQSQARGEIAEAEGQEKRGRARLEEAYDDLETAQTEGNQAETQALDAAQRLAAAFGFLADASPAAVAAVGAAGTPAQEAGAPPQVEEEKDKPWYQDVGDALGGAAKWTGGQIVGVGKGVGEGVVGIGQGGLMLYRLSSVNAMLDPESFDRSVSDLEKTAKYAWDNPGEFGKAVINWEDLSNGRYGEWLGNLAPDLALAYFTAGSGTAATRGARAADTIADVGEVARDVGRAGEAAKAAEGVLKPPVRWNAWNGPGPLGEEVANTFRGASYTEMSLEQPTTFYRAYGGKSPEISDFWSRTAPYGPLQSKMDFALGDWNRAENVVAIRVPPGTTVYEGAAAPAAGQLGGGSQIFIPRQEIDPSWVLP